MRNFMQLNVILFTEFSYLPLKFNYGHITGKKGIPYVFTNQDDDADIAQEVCIRYVNGGVE
jgi:hypothetical protein